MLKWDLVLMSSRASACRKYLHGDALESLSSGLCLKATLSPWQSQTEFGNGRDLNFSTMHSTGPADTPHPPVGFEPGRFCSRTNSKSWGEKTHPHSCSIHTELWAGLGSPGALGHSPANSLLGVVQQDTDDVQEARQQLQGEVEEPDPQACGGGGRDGAAFLGIPSSLGTLCSPTAQPHSLFTAP